MLRCVCGNHTIRRLKPAFYKVRAGGESGAAAQAPRNDKQWSGKDGRQNNAAQIKKLPIGAVETMTARRIDARGKEKNRLSGRDL